MKEKFISYFLPASVSGISAVDSHSVLTVQPMLDSQIVAQSETGCIEDDSDVFQCGKCKKQFTAIEIFMTHKKECSSSLSNVITDVPALTNVTTIPQNTVVVRKIQLPSSLSSYPQSLVLTDADLLQLTAAGLDTNISTTITSCPNIQITANNTLMSQPSYNGQPLTATIQQVIPQITTQDHQQQHALELSVLDEKLISRPLILTSQQTNNAISGLVLNINPTHQKTMLCDNIEQDKINGIIVEPTVAESSEPVITSNQNDAEKEPSTVNIITEFHTSMVRSNKKTTEIENDETQNKKDHKLNCAYCWKSFNKNFDLQQHIRCHTGEKPFQCIVCGRAFAQKSNVKKHMQTHKVWPDGLSRLLPPALLHKSNSSSSDDGETVQEGNSCSDTSENKAENNADGNKEAEEINKTPYAYACPYCKYIGKSYYKLKTHMKQHDTKKVYKCILSTCGLMFTDLDPFLEHTKSHENEMTYRCHECNKNFPSLYDLGSHQFTHSLYPNQRSITTRRFFRCTLCLNKYSTPAALNHHIATSTHSYSCRCCDKVFPCERYLRRHLQIHSGAESFTCNLCGKGFKTENYLKVHMLVHSDEKPFECSTCKAAFNRKDKLKRHLLIHEPVKRYKCPFRTHSGCTKEFNRPDKLKAHILTHSCIKPFPCKFCGRNFTRRTHLRDHMSCHTQEDNSQQACESSEDTFKQSGSSLRDLNDKKEQDCSKIPFVKKRKDFSQTYRLRKQRKRISNCGTKRRGRPRKHVTVDVHIQESSNEQEMDSNSEAADDIPTAHIEIISANHELDTNSDLALPSNISYSDLHFETITNVGTVDQSVSDSSNICTTPLHETSSNIFSSSLQTVSLTNEYS